MKLKFLLLILSICIVGCGKEKETIIRPVETITAKMSVENTKSQYPAVVAPEKEALLSFRVAGPVEKFNVEIGSFVSSGSVIAKLDERDYNLQLEAFKNKELAGKNSYEATKAVAENARKQFVRVETLYREKAIPKKSYDEVLAGVKARKAKELATFAVYQEAMQGRINCENQLKDTSLIAPYDGYIKKKFVDVGSVVGAGIPVVSIASVGNHKIKINISENDLEKFNDVKEANFVYNDKKYPLKLEEVGQVKGATNTTYPVTFSFMEENNIPIDSQGSVDVTFAEEGKNGILVPCEALFEKDGKVIGRQVEPVGHTGQGEIHITVIFLHIDLNFLDELGSGAGAVLLHIVAQLADESLEEFFQLVDVPALEDLL